MLSNRFDRFVSFRLEQLVNYVSPVQMQFGKDDEKRPEKPIRDMRELARMIVSADPVDDRRGAEYLLNIADAVVKCQNSHLINGVTQFVGIGSRKCHQFIARKDRDIDFLRKPCCKSRIPAECLLDSSSGVLHNHKQSAAITVKQRTKLDRRVS